MSAPSRGILPFDTLNALDQLVDRLNSSSGRVTLTEKVGGSLDLVADSSITSAASAGGKRNGGNVVQVLLVGTNEGVGLSRSVGTALTITQLQARDNINKNVRGEAPEGSSVSEAMFEEVLSSIETVWATLVSATPPHIMAATATANANYLNENSDAPYNQPPHPLLSPLQLGSVIRTAIASYENCTLMHIHMPPLVVTIVASPDANLGLIRSVALPILKVLLEPVRRALVRSRGGAARNNEGGRNTMTRQQHRGGQRDNTFLLDPHLQQQQLQQQQMMYSMQQQMVGMNEALNPQQQQQMMMMMMMQQQQQLQQQQQQYVYDQHQLLQQHQQFQRQQEHGQNQLMH